MSRLCSCPRCKKPREIARLRVLPRGFECADIICNFCGFLAQVKGTNVHGRIVFPSGGWKVQKQKLDAGIFHPLFIVRFEGPKLVRIDYIAADFLRKENFARRLVTIRSGRPTGQPRLHQMFDYDLRNLDPSVIVQIWPESKAA